MPFYMPELIVESVIRDGIANIVANPTIIDSVFSELTSNYATRKYGTAEITKIKAIITGAGKKNLAIVHGRNVQESQIPCITIALGYDNEAPHTYLGDHEEDLQEELDLEDAETLAGLTVVTFVPSAYNSINGMVSCPSNTNLANVATGFIFVDADDNEFPIQSGISNETGNKFFFLEVGSEPNIVGACYIRTFVDYTQLEIRGNPQDVQLMLGVHTNDYLLTKYVYILLKYWLKSRKTSLIKRGFLNSKFNGTDFVQDPAFEGSTVYSRYATFTGMVEDNWRSDEVEIIDNIAINATPTE